MSYLHQPVMPDAVLCYLAPKPGDNVIDCTFGNGGYSIAIARRISPDGKVLGVDLDEKALFLGQKEIIRQNIKNIILANGNFKNLENIVDNFWPKKNKKFSGILYDLGLSSAQLEDLGRGFSFRRDSALDMAFGRENLAGGEETKKIVNIWPQKQLAEIIKRYGEEKHAKSIASAIVLSRKRNPIKTTGQLVEIIRQAVPAKYWREKKIHFATKTFQALRIATNDELTNLEKSLPQALKLLKTNGKIVVLSYHSLEDRIVKNYFKQESRGCICAPGAPVCACAHQANIKIITKKPLVPSAAEIAKNPRARSAKLRVGQKI